ncbi:MAG: ATP-binding protein [Ignavibacteriales bacterium]|nr:MAG: ATP-binding protein [Ignavibacteriales bacterium]
MVEQSFHINSDYGNVTLVNKQIRFFLELHGIEQHISNAVEICLTEALNNVIKHSYKNDDTKSIDLIVKKETNYFEITIIDNGLPRKNLTVSKLDFDPQDINNLPESGMGLYIIEQLMDEMKYYTQDGKNYFLLKKWLI